MGLRWWGARDRKALSEPVVGHMDAIADAARIGNWDQVLNLMTEGPRALRAPGDVVNSTRVGGPSGYAPLHQVAWHGGPVAVAERLIELGAWRTLRCGIGQTPLDIAAERGHEHLLAILTPRVRHAVPQPQLDQLEHVLHAVITGRAYDFVREIRMRLPQLGPLTEVETPSMWMAVPGMYGGFSIELSRPGETPELTVESWCRVVGGSGQRHIVRPNGFELVDEGFA
ncbi:ankyrin repeat domain-containing protein [Nocardia niigatensis]|uniref:ankyrin repeat domain-containing protein n=1 Tax=Nocardia niigatensis TaxID=209249 RepID=UPI0002E62381|nr:ankyrin repeat domain-containing protein [Nocardia niigatensis]